MFGLRRRDRAEKYLAGKRIGLSDLFDVSWSGEVGLRKGARMALGV